MANTDVSPVIAAYIAYILYLPLEGTDVALNASSDHEAQLRAERYLKTSGVAKLQLWRCSDGGERLELIWDMDTLTKGGK